MRLSASQAIFDSHAHLIADDGVRYPPAPLSGALRPGDLADPMTAEKLLREMDANGVRIAAAVQRGHIYGFDNSYVCDAAALYPKRFLAVCSIDGRNPDCGSLMRLWIRRGAAGIRMMEPFKGADLSWFAGETARPIWTTAADHDVPVCMHFFRWNRAVGLPALRALLEDYPRTTVVLDHFSNMPCDARAPNYGLDDALLRISELSRVYTKFTTIPLGQLRDDSIDAAPVVQRMVQVFGEKRVMWGSDIAQSKGTYQSMVQIGHDATRLLTEAQRRWVLHDTAYSVYVDDGQRYF